MLGFLLSWDKWLYVWVLLILFCISENSLKIDMLFRADTINLRISWTEQFRAIIKSQEIYQCTNFQNLHYLKLLVHSMLQAVRYARYHNFFRVIVNVKERNHCTNSQIDFIFVTTFLLIRRTPTLIMKHLYFCLQLCKYIWSYFQRVKEPGNIQLYKLQHRFHFIVYMQLF